MRFAIILLTTIALAACEGYMPASYGGSCCYNISPVYIGGARHHYR